MKTNNKQKFIKITINLLLSIVVLSNANFALASEITSEKMVELTNKSRIEAGLNELKAEEKLSEVAEAKAEDMFKNQYFEHTSPDGVTPWFWFEEIGYDYMYAAENLAIDFKTAEGTHKALMKSTGHRENILGANYEEVGIAVVSGEFEGRRTIIVVEEFGTRQKEDIETANMFFEKLEFFSETANVKDQNTAKENQGEKLGYTLSSMFSVKNPLILKDTYTENIYWEEADEEKNLIAASSYKIKIKNFFDILSQKIIEI